MDYFPEVPAIFLSSKKLNKKLCFQDFFLIFFFLAMHSACPCVDIGKSKYFKMLN